MAMPAAAPARRRAARLPIPYVDLARAHAPLRDEILEAVGAVVDHGQFILGGPVEDFEERFADLCGTRFAVAVNSGTDALALALRALGIGPGDEVITVPNSFVATAAAIRLCGARPVFVDVRDDLNLDPDWIPRVLTERTRAILPVHLTGRPADMDAIREAARVHHLWVVEDCAQAVAAEHRGRPVGSMGHAGCFSFHPLKTLGACGDGGAVVTGDEQVHRRLVRLRNLGLEDRDHCSTFSGNSRLDSIQAAILLLKIKHLAGWTERRRAAAAFYREALGGIRGLRPPGERPHEKAVYHTFVVEADRRDELKRFLEERGIGTAIHYPIPIHLQEAAAGLGHRPGDFPVAERLSGRILSLPIYPELSREDLERVAGAIREFYGA
jgi:dTDP-4-amino-4,6-dideoxygalactose transaminase